MIDWAVVPLENDEPFLVGKCTLQEGFSSPRRGLRLPQAGGDVGSEPQLEGRSGVPYSDDSGIRVRICAHYYAQVMIDLHGAPGSQNGFDNSCVQRLHPKSLLARGTLTSFINSGIRGRREWFWNQTNIDRTLSALTALTSEFTRSTYGNTVQTIELINEPFPWTADELNTLKQFYQSAYSAVDAAREDGHGTMVVAIDAAFQGLDAWDGFTTEPQFHNVALDDVSA